MAFAMDIPMAFAIQWVLPCDWALYSTMGFAKDIPLGFAMRWALHIWVSPVCLHGFCHVADHYIHTYLVLRVCSTKSNNTAKMCENFLLFQLSWLTKFCKSYWNSLNIKQVRKWKLFPHHRNSFLESVSLSNAVLEDAFQNGENKWSNK